MMWVERSSKASADNYWVKILGGVGAQLLVKAAVAGCHVAGSHIPKYGCNNMGVVIHKTHCKQPMLEKQTLLWRFKPIMSTYCIGGQMYHVHGHMHELLRCNQLSVEQMVNCRVGKHAAEALVQGASAQRFITRQFPFENTRLLVTGFTVTGLPKSALTQHWGARVVRTHLTNGI